MLQFMKDVLVAALGNDAIREKLEDPQFQYTQRLMEMNNSLMTQITEFVRRDKLSADAIQSLGSNAERVLAQSNKYEQQVRVLEKQVKELRLAEADQKEDSNFAERLLEADKQICKVMMGKTSEAVRDKLWKIRVLISAPDDPPSRNVDGSIRSSEEDESDG